MVGKIVGVQIPLVPFLGIGVGVDVLQLPWESSAQSLLHIADGGIQSQMSGIRLWRGCHKHCCIPQGNPGLRHTQHQGHIHTGLDNGNDLRIGQAYVLCRNDHEPPASGLHLSHLQKACQIVAGSIRV